MSGVLDDLTDADIEELGSRIQAKRIHDMHRLPDPVPPAPGSWEHDKMLADERKRAARSAADAAREAEREAREEHERQEWEANAPKRAKAQAELERVEAQLQPIEEKREELRLRAAELRVEANR